MLQRDQKSKTDFELGLVHKTRHSYIDGTDIEVQRQKTTAMQVGGNHRQYLGASVLDASLKWQKGLPWYADAGPTDGMKQQRSTICICSALVILLRCLLEMGMMRSIMFPCVGKKQTREYMAVNSFL